MKRRKKRITFLLAVVMLGLSFVVLTGCKGNDEPSNSTSNSTEQSTNTGSENTGSHTSATKTSDTTNTGTGGPVTPPKPTIDEEMIYPETDLDDGKRRNAEGLRIYSHGNDTVYFGDTFTAEGYEVYMVYYEYDNVGQAGLSVRTAVKIENFAIDDSKVNYLKEGKYVVRITGRVRSDSATSNVTINVKADRYGDIVQERHLYGIRCLTKLTGKVGMNVADIKAQEVYVVYTENKYENNELVLEEVRIRSGYSINVDDVDTTKAGQYPVYVQYTETYQTKEYGEVQITVTTFFVLVLEAA